jgi:hypothetical protein
MPMMINPDLQSLQALVQQGNARREGQTYSVVNAPPTPQQQPATGRTKGQAARAVIAYTGKMVIL